MSTSSADSTPSLSDECGPHCGTMTVGAAHRLTRHCAHCHTQETTQEEVLEDDQGRKTDPDGPETSLE